MGGGKGGGVREAFVWGKGGGSGKWSGKGKEQESCGMGWNVLGIREEVQGGGGLRNGMQLEKRSCGGQGTGWGWLSLGVGGG